MTQSLLMVGLFLAVMVSAPFALKWLRKQNLGASQLAGCQAKVLSAVAVGPHQRVVTIEVGADDARVRLTLGVTAQSISVLHSAPTAQEPAHSAANPLPFPVRVCG